MDGGGMPSSSDYFVLNIEGVTKCRKPFPYMVVLHRLEQCGAYCKYRRWRSRMVVLLLAMSHFALAICPGACCLASLLVLLLHAACT